MKRNFDKPKKNTTYTKEAKMAMSKTYVVTKSTKEKAEPAKKSNNKNIKALTEAARKGKEKDFNERG